MSRLAVHGFSVGYTFGLFRPVFALQSSLGFLLYICLQMRVWVSCFSWSLCFCIFVFWVFRTPDITAKCYTQYQEFFTLYFCCRFGACNSKKKPWNRFLFVLVLQICNRRISGCWRRLFLFLFKIFCLAWLIRWDSCTIGMRKRRGKSAVQT